MRLYENEGKRLLAQADIRVPEGVVVDSPARIEGLPARLLPAVVKAQVLWGRRGKAGGIIACTDAGAVRQAVEKLLDRSLFGEKIRSVLVEKKLDVVREAYLSVTYRDRKPVVMLSAAGGADIEETAKQHPEQVVIEPARISHPLSRRFCADIARRAGFAGDDASRVAAVIARLFHFFVHNDCLLVEINPLVKTRDGTWYAVDAKIEVDDEASPRLGHLHLPDRLGSGREPSRLELLARQNDLVDTRGAAGRMFYEIEGGNIVILAAGGGTSMEALDNLCLLGGRPAIFTEYSGNPTGDKVKGLTKIALQYPGRIDAIWVVGGRANFTDIYETLVNGVLAGLRETPGFDRAIPLVVRRAGPRDREAFEVLRRAREKEGFNIYLRGTATSIAESARMVIYHANKHYTLTQKRQELL